MKLNHQVENWGRHVLELYKDHQDEIDCHLIKETSTKGTITEERF